MIFLDTETCGLVGPVVIIQYARDNGPPIIYDVWESAASTTVALIETIAKHEEGICGFNLSFDWFHLQRAHNILSLLGDAIPTIDAWRSVERQAVFGPCVKPVSAIDVMLHARKGPCQALMPRDDVRIRKVTDWLVEPLREELLERIQFDGIYFARRSNGYDWEIARKEECPAFPDLVLKFGAVGGLKPLSRYLLGAEVVDYPLPREWFPKENDWDIFGDSWVSLLKRHIDYWHSDQRARKYAADDVILTRSLWEHFGKPPSDTDSVLACQIGSSRWRGYSLDLGKLNEAKASLQASKSLAVRAPLEVLAKLRELATPTQRLAIQDTTATTLEEIGKWPGEIGSFARAVTTARSAEKELDICEKLLSVGRAHFDFKVIGTLSGRMSGGSQRDQRSAGGGSINPQGIPKGILREAFIFTNKGEFLEGGDFSGFEVAIAAAVYNNKALSEDLKSGLKIHALYGSSIFNEPYEAIVADKNKYDRAKSAVFATIYGAQDQKISDVLGLDIGAVSEGTRRFFERYPGVGEARQRISDKFCSMRQPAGIGTAVEWHEPADYIDSLFGFRRYFTLENKLCWALFELANEPPKRFREHDKYANVQRTVGRRQKPSGAIQSALYAAAFGIQAANMRQAANHEIQSSGATITKALQRAIWDLQPSGVHKWVVSPLNIHDEIMCPTTVGLRPLVNDFITEFSDSVPLLAIDWKRLQNWSEK